MSLVPERRRCPPKWWVPFQGGTISGETCRKGDNLFSCLGDGKPEWGPRKMYILRPGKERVQYFRVRGREACLAGVSSHPQLSG